MLVCNNCQARKLTVYYPRPSFMEFEVSGFDTRASEFVYPIHGELLDYECDEYLIKCDVCDYEFLDHDELIQLAKLNKQLQRTGT